MLAVTVVVLDHLFHWPSGGFIGVDVFFVVSGFLITGLLLREYEKTGTISFVEFYRRRVRRIMPVAVLVLGVTLAASWLLLFANRFTGILWDGIWAFFFAANWRFAIAGTNYFEATDALSPLQHFWSLSVEEQFYFVWPWLMLGAFVLLAARSKADKAANAHRVAGVMIGVLSVASFAWAVYESTTNPTVAYFSTFSRAWELGVGAVLATSTRLLTRIPSWCRPVLAYVGLGMIVASLFVVSTASTFPAPWALLPVAGTALVIASGTGAPARGLVPLTNPVSTYLGDISYSIYLWHFPIIVLATTLAPELDLVGYVGVVALILLSSVASYHLVELPINQSPLLEPLATQRLEWQPWRSKWAASYKYGGVAVLFAVTIAIAVPVLTPQAEPVVAAVAPAPVAADAAPAVTLPPAQAAIVTELDAALAAASWPVLTPTLDELSASSKVPEWVKDGCLGDELRSQGAPADNAQRDTCVYGNPAGSKTAIVVGDSIGISWVPAVRAALQDDDWRILVYTLRECPVSQVTVTNADGSDFPECDPFRDWMLSEVATVHPQLLIMSEAYSTMNRLASEASGADAIAEVQAGMTTTVSSLSASADSIVVLGAPPKSTSLAQCASKTSTPSACVTQPESRFIDVQAALAEAVPASGASNARYVDTRTLFCSPNSNQCPAFAGGLITLADGWHMTGDYSTHIGSAVRELLLPAG